jgi:alkylation response protein AidB-like acyl-CoA dehydrogenase
LDFDDTPQEAAVRKEIRAWLQDNAPGKGSTDYCRRSELDRLALAKAFQAKLFDAGLAGLAWPEEYGGRGGSAIEQMIFEQELAGFDAPWGVFFVIGIGMAGPTIIAHGSPAQKERFLRPTLRGDVIWCQLFSEPGAGSDLAGLRTSAVRDGDEFVISGQKIWTSGGHYSDWGILIARTDFEAPKHRGLTYFLCDMSLPGIELRPIKQINGDAHFNETFFDDVRIPADMVLGEVGGGWAVAMTTLSNERTAIGGGGANGVGFADLHALARRVGRSSDAVVRQELAAAFTRGQVSRFLGYRAQTALSRGEPLGPESSILKLFHGLDLARTTNLALELLGPAGTVWDGDDASWFHEWATAPSMRIAGGTDEIQRNVLAERVLGLPAEPRPDKAVPFNTIPVGI